MNSSSRPSDLPAKTPDFIPEILRFRPRRRRRTDKIARLPSAIRDSINHMLDEGLPKKKNPPPPGRTQKNPNKKNLSPGKERPPPAPLQPPTLAQPNPPQNGVCRPTAAQNPGGPPSPRRSLQPPRRASDLRRPA